MKKIYMLPLLVVTGLYGYAQQNLPVTYEPVQKYTLKDIPGSAAQATKEKVFSIYITDTQLLRALPKGDGTLSIQSRDQRLAAIFSRYTITAFELAYPESRFEYMHLYFRIRCNSLELMNELMAYDQKVFAMAADETPETLGYTPDDYTNYSQNTAYLDYINAKDAFEITKGSESVIVGMTDTWVDSTHTELSGGKIAKARLMLSMLGNHGTEVAGLLAGNTDNTSGFSSVGFRTRLDVSSQMGVPNELLTMSKDGRRILNGSWKMSTEDCPGYYGSNAGVFGWNGIFNEIYENGTFCVFSAGNGASASCGTTDSNLSAYAYPASLEHCFSVTTVGHNYELGTSNFNQAGSYGPYYYKGVHRQKATDEATAYHHNDRVDIAAPGYNIPVLGTSSSAYKTGTAAGNGTSYAAPMVSGTAALMLAANPALSPYQLEWILKDAANADIYDISYNSSYLSKLGAGRLDAGAAVEAARDFNCADAATQTFRVRGIEVNTRCAPGLSTPLINPKLTPVLENGTAPFTYKWEAIPGGASMAGNSVTLSAYDVEQPEIISYTDSGIVYFRLTVTDNSPISKKVASKVIRFKLQTAAVADLAVADAYADNYDEKNGMMQLDNRDWDFWNSPDMWNRLKNDEIQEHQAPGFSSKNYLYVRYKNVGCVRQPTTSITAYYSYASVAGLRGSDFDGSITYPGTTATRGKVLGTTKTTSLLPGREAIVAFSWSPPAQIDTVANTNDIAFFFNVSTAAAGLPSDTNKLIYKNVVDTNHIVTKNEYPCVLEDSVAPVSRHRILVGNSYRNGSGQYFTLQMINDKTIHPHLAGDMPSFVETSVKLDSAVYNSWIAGGALGTYFSKNDATKTVTFDGKLMELKHIEMNRGKITPAIITFKLKTGVFVRDADYQVHFRQLDEQDSNRVTGVGTYNIHTNERLSLMSGRLSQTEYSHDYLAYPNPVNSMLQLTYKGREQQVSVRVFDIVGRVVLQEDRVTVGATPYSLNFSGLIDGIYIVDISDASGKSEQIKVIKQ